MRFSLTLQILCFALTAWSQSNDRTQAALADTTEQFGSSFQLAHKIAAYYQDQLNKQEAVEKELERFDGLRTVLINSIEETDKKDSEQKTDLSNQLKEIERQIKNRQITLKAISKNLETAEQVSRAKPHYQAKWIAKYEKKYGEIETGIIPYESVIVMNEPEKNNRNNPLEATEVEAPLIRDLPPPPPPVTNSKPKSDKRKTVAVTGHKYRPPSHPTAFSSICSIEFDGIDPFSQKRKIEMQKQVFFEHTHAELKPYFKDQVYLTCYAQFSAQPGFKYLTLEFDIASDRAKQSFGGLQKGALITVRFLNGDYINLVNANEDIGAVDFENKRTTYFAQFVIDKKTEKSILESEIDQVRVTWSSGYEDYNIYEMDLWKDQIACLNESY